MPNTDDQPEEEPTIPLARPHAPSSADDIPTRLTVGETTAQLAAGMPKRIGPYVIERELGRGGQAGVFLATDPRLGRQVALKVLPGGSVAATQARDRFLREAQIASRLDHPAICPVYDLGDDEGTLWIAMRRIEGEPLTQKLRHTTEEGLVGDPNEIAEMIEKVARGLHAAHEIGIVHRDIKPGNIMITHDGNPVILDFGLAGINDDDTAALTVTGDVFGTPGYMSPEQVRGERLDARTDVFSLGVVLYESLTGQRPFSAPTVEGLHRAIREVSPPTPMSLTSAIGRDLDTITMTALAKETNRRYATAADLAEDLARFRRGEPVMARRPGPLDQAWRWARRHPVAVAVMAVVAALLLLIGILSARVWTTWDDVEQQALAQRDREVESLVARGFREGRPEKGDAAIERARANFEAALELDPSRIDAAGGLLLTSYWSRPLEETAALLASRFGDIQDRPAIRMFDGLIKSRLATNDPEPIRLDLTSMQSAPAVEWFLIGRQIAGLGWELQDQEISRQSLEALTVAVATSPAPRFFFHNELCSSAWDSGEIETLGRFARAMVELWPEEPEGWFYQGCALHNRDLVRARAAYEKALSIDERQAGVWANLVSIHIREGRRELALDCARRAVAIDPQAGHAQQALAAALLELERPEEALEPARRALELIPRHVRARVVVVDALDALDRHDEAWATITEGLQLMPKNGEMQNLAGVHLMRTERVANAEAYFRQTTHWLPEFSAGWNNRVTALIALRRWAEAWEVSQVLRDKWPDDPRNWITSSILAYRLISARTAAEYLKRAASLRPDDADIAYRLAIALQHDGQPQQALEVVDAFADSGDPRLAGRREELILDAEHQALYRRWKAGEYELDDDLSTLQGIAFQAWALGDFEGASTIYLRIEDDFGVSAIPAIFAAPSLLGSTRDDPSSDQARDRRELALIVSMDLVDQGKSSPNPAMQGDLDGLVVALLHAPAFEFVRQGLGFRPDELARWSRFWVKARAVDEGLRSP